MTTLFSDYISYQMKDKTRRCVLLLKELSGKRKMISTQSNSLEIYLTVLQENALEFCTDFSILLRHRTLGRLVFRPVCVSVCADVPHVSG